MPSNHNIYEFGEFRLDEEEETLYQENIPISLDNKAVQILLLLVSKNGQLVTREEMMKKVWPDTFVEDNAIDNRLSNIRKVLGISKSRRAQENEGIEKNNNEKINSVETSFDIITFRKKSAYKFTGEVKRILKDKTPNLVDEAEETLDPSPDFPLADGGSKATVEDELKQITRENDSTDDLKIYAFLGLALIIAAVYFERGWFYGSQIIETPWQLIYVLTACFCYAILNSIGLILEVAYQFDKYGWKTVKMVPAVFFVSLFAMFWALTHGVFMLSSGITVAIGTGFLILAASALITCGLGYFVLPNFAVAVATFNTQPAFTAFRKNVLFYFLPIYSAFCLAVFCLMNTNYSGLVNTIISVMLLVLLLVISFISYFSTNYLSDRLLSEKEGIKYPRKPLYSSFLMWRTVFCFIPTIVFVCWYLLRSLENFLRR